MLWGVPNSVGKGLLLGHFGQELPASVEEVHAEGSRDEKAHND